MKRTTTPLAIVGAAMLLAATAACGTGGDAADSTAAADSAAAAAAATPATPAAGATDSATNAGFLDPNTATAAQLATVPSLDSATAAALVAGRPYAKMTDVDKVLAAKLSEAQRDTVYTRLWKPIDLNTATDAEIQLIPNLGPRMLGEFKEYRPYPQIEKFRREIGKYVNQKEVARMERYVTLK